MWEEQCIWDNFYHRGCKTFQHLLFSAPEYFQIVSGDHCLQVHDWSNFFFFFSLQPIKNRSHLSVPFLGVHFCSCRVLPLTLSEREVLRHSHTCDLNCYPGEILCFTLSFLVSTALANACEYGWIWVTTYRYEIWIVNVDLDYMFL